MFSLSHISYEIGGRSLFQSLQLELGSAKYGLVGPNGVGKSTLAKLMAGLLEPDDGFIRRPSSVSYLSQREEPPDCSVIEYLDDEGAGFSKSRFMVRSLLSKIEDESPLRSLSGGEWMRVRLAKVAAQAESFVILDEPTNDLDRDGKEAVLDFLRSHEGGILLISHDREALRTMNEILELSNQGLQRFGVNFDDYTDLREAEDARLADHLRQSKKERDKTEREMHEKIARQEKRMREGKKAADKGGLPRILLGARKRKAQQSMGRIVHRETGVTARSQEKATSAWSDMKIDPFIRFDFEAAKPSPSKIHFNVLDLSLDLPPPTGTLWQRPLTFVIKGSERWHLRGANGVGKSTLLKILLGQDAPHVRITQGHVRRGSSHLVVLGQSDHGFHHDRPLLEDLLETSRFSATDLRNELAFFGFTGQQALQPSGSLSGGEYLKAALAKAFLGPTIPDLIVLDEPTNNLDLGSIELLETALRRFQGGLLVVSHDADFAGNIGITHELILGESASVALPSTTIRHT